MDICRRLYGISRDRATELQAMRWRLLRIVFNDDARAEQASRILRMISERLRYIQQADARSREFSRLAWSTD